MGEVDESFYAVPKLPYLHIRAAAAAAAAANMDSSPEHPSTPPLQTSASVPFKWEEQPGKPRPCTGIIIPLPEPAKSLELPPCRNNKITETPSPTTVLDGPYNVGRPKFSSFRFFRESGQDDSFDSFSTAYCSPPEGNILLGSCKKSSRGFFGKFKGGKKVVDGGSSRFSPSSNSSSCESTDESVKNSGGVKMRRNGSFSSVSQARSSHLWSSICEGIKQVIQWKSSKKSNKEGR